MLFTINKEGDDEREYRGNVVTDFVYVDIGDYDPEDIWLTVPVRCAMFSDNTPGVVFNREIRRLTRDNI